MFVDQATVELFHNAHAFETLIIKKGNTFNAHKSNQSTIQQYSALLAMTAVTNMLAPTEINNLCETNRNLFVHKKY
jgi:hypothetical protein